MLLISLHSVILYLVFWYNRRWKITKIVKIWCAMAVFFIWAYLISVISINKFFSYSGSTSVFMALSFASFSIIIYEAHMIKHCVNFNKYLRAADSSEMHEKPQDLVAKAKNMQRKGSRNIIITFSILYFLFLIIYGATVNTQAEYILKGLGWMNWFLIVVTDSIIIRKFLPI